MKDLPGILVMYPETICQVQGWFSFLFCLSLKLDSIQSVGYVLSKRIVYPNILFGTKSFHSPREKIRSLSALTGLSTLKLPTVHLQIYALQCKSYPPQQTRSWTLLELLQFRQQVHWLLDDLLHLRVRLVISSTSWLLKASTHLHTTSFGLNIISFTSTTSNLFNWHYNTYTLFFF